MASSDSPNGDPWRSFGYIVAGVLVYGAVGWGLDHWLGTRFLVAVGIIAGAALGIYLTWARYRPEPSDLPSTTRNQDTEPPNSNTKAQEEE
ncbi:hypothetical protein [Nocardioides sp.]|uniref:AtpZ/AtpI family protein n=1 Tax=Nocardioides sp. TaxID=35761 RepID=UPI0039E5E89E